MSLFFETQDPYQDIIRQMSRLMTEQKGSSQQRQTPQGQRPANVLVPPLNEYDMGDHILVLMELPGCVPDDINLEFSGNKLVVFGTKKLFKYYDNSENVVRQESEFGNFRRRIKIPGVKELNEGNINAKLENGLLEIRVTKATSEELKPKKINIQLGSETKKGKYVSKRH